MNKVQNEQTKKWLRIFGSDLPRPGIYLPCDIHARHGLILMREEEREAFDEGVYEVSIYLPDVGVVRFMTDSVEVLKGLSNQAFDLPEFARTVCGLKAQVIFEGGYIDSAEEGFEIISPSLRIIPRADGEYCFEVRLVK